MATSPWVDTFSLTAPLLIGEAMTQAWRLTVPATNHEVGGRGKRQNRAKNVTTTRGKTARSNAHALIGNP